MKKFKLLSVMAVCLAAFAFTSCNTGDGDSFEWPTLDQQKSMISNLGYMQNGGLVYYNENKLNTKDVTDTIPNITINMSMSSNKDDKGNITSYYSNASLMFPVKILSNFISDEKLAAEIAKITSVSAKVYLVPYQYATQRFIANTDDIKLGDITTEDNKTYKDVTIKFTAGYYAAGFVTNEKTQKQDFLIYIGAASIYVNNNQTSLLTNYKDAKGTLYPPVFWFTTDKSN